VNNKIFALTDNQLMLLVSGAIIFGFVIGLLIGWWRGKNPVTKSEKEKWQRAVDAEKAKQMLAEWEEKKVRLDEIGKVLWETDKK
jgi:hypothetical protein